MTLKLTKSKSHLPLWKSYEYIGPGDDIAHTVHYENDGGPGNRPYIWADDSMWSIDFPENPNSILSLFFFRNWVCDAPINLRDASIEFHLRGDRLDLKGAQCFFWISSYIPTTTRWHYVKRSLSFSDGHWGDLIKINLTNDENLWHRSFSVDPQQAGTLDQTLSACISYGFSFIGFSEKVTGKLSLGSFSISSFVAPAWPYAADLNSNADAWLTVSQMQKKQIPIPYCQFIHELNENRICLQKKKTMVIKDDFFRFPDRIPYSYFAFIRSSQSTKSRDLRDSLLMLEQREKDLDLKEGSLHFFVEHSQSNTRWIFLELLQKEKNCQILYKNEVLWYRLSGEAPLEDVLSGDSGKLGYDYLGIIAVGIKDTPTGTWALEHLSIGPQIELDDNEEPNLVKAMKCHKVMQ